MDCEVLIGLGEVIIFNVGTVNLVHNFITYILYISLLVFFNSHSVA